MRVRVLAPKKDFDVNLMRFVVFNVFLFLLKIFSCVGCLFNYSICLIAAVILRDEFIYCEWFRVHWIFVHIFCFFLVNFPVVTFKRHFSIVEQLMQYNCVEIVARELEIMSVHWISCLFVCFFFAMFIFGLCIGKTTFQMSLLQFMWAFNCYC